MRTMWPPLAAALAALGVRRAWRAGRANHPWADLGWPGRGAGARLPHLGNGDAEGVRAAFGIADVNLQAGHAGRRGSGGLTLRGRCVPQWLTGRNSDPCCFSSAPLGHAQSCVFPHQSVGEGDGSCTQQLCVPEEPFLCSCVLRLASIPLSAPSIRRSGPQLRGRVEALNSPALNFSRNSLGRW